MIRKILYAVIVLTVITELFLRFYFGFCDNVLFRSDENYEYIAQPNQNRFRFRNHIEYNANSMRSQEVDSSSYVVLGLGDSVINGGVLTDQTELATTILSDTLSKIKGKKVQFLNISAGSWGPDNCSAYIDKNGIFNAKSIWLFVSSHDAYDNMEFDNVVGVHPSYPRGQYSIAIYEILDRYILPKFYKIIKKQRVKIDRDKFLGINKKKINSEFNTGFKDIFNLSVKHQIPMVIYLHAEKKELKAGKYTDQGQEIIKFANQNNIKLIKDLENGIEFSDYRDEIHLNASGQKKLAHIVLKSLR
ncbi:hypothetical protein [Wenyingzhuangia aestuarii]|uniref:hypothetical protein n=1 Tax=Wenyingzhuangia aestuarii TaxID=1647582 RepID=UPI00143BB2A9|nr:hypothetical protein [Wenyingzhuangia aestuarii]NJB83260.1 hypothetical protein [Wenyingzhuangia aestuarii]